MSHQPFGSGDHLCFGYRWPILLMWGDKIDPADFSTFDMARMWLPLNQSTLIVWDTSVHTEQDGKLRRRTWEAIPVCGQSAEQCFPTVCVVIYSHASSDFTPLSTPSWGTSCCAKELWEPQFGDEMETNISFSDMSWVFRPSWTSDFMCVCCGSQDGSLVARFGPGGCRL